MNTGETDDTATMDTIQILVIQRKEVISRRELSSKRDRTARLDSGEEMGEGRD